MENRISKGHRIALILNFVWVLIGLALCVNYFFLPNVGTEDIIANVSLILAFVSLIGYMLFGYKRASDIAFGIPLFLYSICILIMLSTSTVAFSTPAPVITASLCTLLIYPIVIAFNQNRIKVCLPLFILIIISELLIALVIFMKFAPDGIIAGGNPTVTLGNIHIFVRTFLTVAMTLCYLARYMRLKK